MSDEKKDIILDKNESEQLTPVEHDKSNEIAQSEEKEVNEIKEMHWLWKFLLYAITFFVPIIGIVVGGIFMASKNRDEGKKRLGKRLVIFGVVIWVLEFVFRLAGGGVG